VVNQFAIINIISELKRPTQKRISKVISRSAIFPLLIYLTLGLVGYATYGSYVPSVIVQRNAQPGKSDLLMTIARLSLIICLFTGIIIRSNSNTSNLVNIIFQIKVMSGKKVAIQNKPENAPESTERIVTHEPYPQQEEKQYVISGPTELPPQASAVEGPNYSDIQGTGYHRVMSMTKSSDAGMPTPGLPRTPDKPSNQPEITAKQCPNELPNDPEPEEPECDEDTLCPPEPTTCVRLTFRMLMGLIPAILAVFLSQSVIGTIETASGFLAPPFVIIFPALMSLKLRSQGKISMNPFMAGLLWTFVIIFGVGSYVFVILKLVLN